MSLFEWIDLPMLGDERGALVAVEGNQSIPFEIKRVYYIYATKAGVSRGFHAHNTLRQVVVCVSGLCRMILDDGQSRESQWMANPAQGLVVNEMIWHEMHDFSDDCVLLVLASEHYDESDYIRDYHRFIEQTSSGKGDA